MAFSVKKSAERGLIDYFLGILLNVNLWNRGETPIYDRLSVSEVFERMIYSLITYSWIGLTDL